MPRQIRARQPSLLPEEWRAAIRRRPDESMRKTKLGAALLAAYAVFLAVMLDRQGETFAARASARAASLAAAAHATAVEAPMSASAAGRVSPTG